MAVFSYPFLLISFINTSFQQSATVLFSETNTLIMHEIKEKDASLYIFNRYNLSISINQYVMLLLIDALQIVKIVANRIGDFTEDANNLFNLIMIIPLTSTIIYRSYLKMRSSKYKARAVSYFDHQLEVNSS